MTDHRRIDERSLAFGRAIAAKVQADPKLILRAKANVERWLTTCSPRAKTSLIEWLEMLNGPTHAIFDLLTSRDERATRLRQSNPFAGVLSSQERNAILRKFESDDAATA